MNTTRPINVYAELTPNPNSLKFVADVMLLEGGSVEYNHIDETTNCPLAKQLFSFSGVNKVFINSNFVTINKESEVDWFDITNILREFIRGFLMSEEKLFLSSPFDEQHIPNKRPKVAKAEVKTEAKPARPQIETEPDPEADKKIMELLDEYIRPAVEGDGGAIHFRSFKNGVVSVVLKGACSGCPSSTVTLKSGIENLLKQMVPGVEEVVAVSE
jgi:NFU1 iron-sulfur cluster scaffold homolog, mitochondrial